MDNKALTANWRTTSAGALTLLVSIASVFVIPWLNGEPVSLAVILTKENLDAAIGVVVGIGLLLSRDAKVSSEKSGVPTPAVTKDQVGAVVDKKVDEALADLGR